MNILGISGRDRDAAAALAVDGQVVSAAAEESFARVPGIGYAQTGGFPRAAARACLDRAGLEAADVDQVVVVDDGRVKPSGVGNGALRGVPMREVAAVRADALQAGLSAPPGADVVLVCGSDPAAMAIFTRGGADLGPKTDVDGAEGLARVAGRLAAILGLESRDPFAALDRLSLGAAPMFVDELAPALEWRAGAALRADADQLATAAVRVAGEHASALADAESMNARLQDRRREIAASFTCQLARVMAGVITHAADTHRGSTVAVGGSLFGNARFNTELARLADGRYAIAHVPEALGRAVGAVAPEAAAGEAPARVTLGPRFSEEDIKRTLDNCRLDYVYEPDWPRLIARASKMLAQGKVVAWFQGAMAFGPRALGTRSILADPSSRYVRQNINEYLRQRPLDEPLPLALAPSMAARCLDGGAVAAGVRDADVASAFRDRLAGALSAGRQARVHAASQDLDASFRDLLDCHAAATGTPGLVEVNLAGPGEPVACTPRDAVRTVYSSAIDALVIGRFLLMKDYWLLRNQS